jgi:hypothetical protein
MERETAGDPISGVKWTRKTTEKIAWQLKRLGIIVSRNTVGRLLRLMKYSLRTNRKTISAGSTSDRDRQFRYLCRQRDQFEKRGDPVRRQRRRHSVWHLRYSGQPRLGFPGHFPRNIRLRRLLPPQMVAAGRPQALPAIRPNPHPGRYRRQQWGTAWRLEARNSTSTVRWPGLMRHCFPLPFRRLQMESHRAPPVLRDLQELGRRAS